MYAAYSQRSSRRRATSFALAVAAHLLIALLLLRLAPRTEPKPPEDAPFAAFDVAPAAEDTPKPAEQPHAAASASRSAAAEAATPLPAPPAPAPAPATEAKPPPMLMIPGGMELFDIGKVRGSTDDGAGDGDAGESVAAYGPGEGPGGQRLFNAEWYREPSRAELAGYLPAGAPPGGWALIACRTVENYHVDNCRSLGEGPAGSGLARAMRQAAWQFRVRPPRLGGKTMIGAWVRIRFDFDRQPGGGGTN